MTDSARLRHQPGRWLLLGEAGIRVPRHSSPVALVGARGRDRAALRRADFDAATGKLDWKGDVERLPVAHSEYFNETTLSWFEGNVALRGEESSVSTFQLFRASDGKRLLADSRDTW